MLILPPPIKNNLISSEKPTSEIKITLSDFVPKYTLHCRITSDVSWMQGIVFPEILHSHSINKCPVFQHEWKDTWYVPMQRMLPWIHQSGAKDWQHLMLLEVENRYWDICGNFIKPYPKTVERFLNLLRISSPRMQIQEYANELKVSQQYLNKNLRQFLGCSANALVQFRILLEAKNQLVFSNLPIKTIAYELEFTELANFYNFFRKNTGLTPNQYRQYLQ